MRDQQTIEDEARVWERGRQEDLGTNCPGVARASFPKIGHRFVLPRSRLASICQGWWGKVYIIRAIGGPILPLVANVAQLWML